MYAGFACIFFLTAHTINEAASGCSVITYVLACYYTHVKCIVFVRTFKYSNIYGYLPWDNFSMLNIATGLFNK